MTYAIMATGGKQYRVAPGDVLRVPALRAQVGETVELPVLAMSDGERVIVGRPWVEGARVVCRVLEHGKERKVIVFKFKRRKQYRRKKGHRQKYTALRVEAIEAA